MMNWFIRIPPALSTAISFICVPIIGLLDYLTGIELSFSIFYFLPLTIVGWVASIRVSLLFAVFCAAMWASADYFGGHQYSSGLIFVFNTLVRLAIFFIFVFLMYRLRVNSELVFKNKLLAEKSFHVINTTQKIITVISKNITTHNSNLLLWVAKEKSEGRVVPTIVEKTCRTIGSNLAALTEISYSYHVHDKQPIEIEQFMDALQHKVEETSKRNTE